MTREDGIFLLRRYRREETRIPCARLLGWRRNYQFDRAVYERWLVQEMIRRLLEEGGDPIELAREIYHGMEDIICGSESPGTWAFASTIQNCAADILCYLRDWERRT